MAVNPNETIIHQEGRETASVLIGLAELQGYTVHHVRAQEGGFAVPDSVARAFLTGGVTQGTPAPPEALVVPVAPPQTASQGIATPTPERTTSWTPERRARQAALMREQHQRRKEAALKEAGNG